MPQPLAVNLGCEEQGKSKHEPTFINCIQCTHQLDVIYIYFYCLDELRKLFGGFEPLAVGHLSITKSLWIHRVELQQWTHQEYILLWKKRKRVSDITYYTICNKCLVSHTQGFKYWPMRMLELTSVIGVWFGSIQYAQWLTYRTKTRKVLEMMKVLFLTTWLGKNLSCQHFD